MHLYTIRIKWTVLNIFFQTKMNTTSTFIPSDHDDGIEHPLHPVIIILRTIFITLNIVLVIVSNIFCIMVTKKSTTMEDATKVFTISLAMTDLSIGLVSVSAIFSSAFDMWPFGSIIVCQLNSDLFCSLCTLSQIFLSCLGVDRLKAVKKPLQYHKTMTKKRAQITVVSVWFFVTTFYVFVIPYSGYVSMDYEYRKALTGCTFICRKQDIYTVISGLLMIYFIPFAVVTTIYSKLLLVSRAQIQRIRKQFPMGPKPKLQGSILMFTFAMLAGVVAWTPLTLIVLYECSMQKQAPPYVEFIAVCLPVSNSWWNVLIYARSNLSWRETCVQMLRKMFKIKYFF